MPGDRDSPPAEQRIGNYRLLRPLGRGGMGVVYLAARADEEFRKRVAIKVLHPSMESDEILARFYTERQILAGLDHPHVARLLDGGSTEEGLPYFVMEYVEGEPIDVYCDNHRLSTRERLELFCAVCSAVQYAHQNLIVHRDLKPANILVTGAGVPKLLDFGIAKVLNPEVSNRTLAATRLWPMTPDYASPEQLRGEPVTTTSDVFALGVLLYELLTGHHPFRAEGRSLDGLREAVCEGPLESPSEVIRRRRELTELDGTVRVVSPETVSRTRDGDPNKLRRRLGGDVDNIVLKALRREPQRRYGSVERLADDVRRHLAGLPVSARGDSFVYRAGKFLRRHRLAVAAVAVFVAACLAFGIAMGFQRAEITRQWRRAEDERQRAEAGWRRAEGERLRAERVTELMIDLFEVSDPLKPSAEKVSALELLEQAEHRLETELADEPEIRAALLESLGLIFQRLGLLERAGASLETALEIRRQLHGAEHPLVAESLNLLAELRLDAGGYEAASGLFEEALEMRRRLLGDGSPAVAETLDSQGNLYQALGDYARAVPLHRRALEIRRQKLNREHPDLADNLQNLAVALYYRGDLEAAEPLYREALKLHRRYRGERHPRVALLLNNLAALLVARGDMEAAEGMLREALAMRVELLGEHPDVAESQHNLATLLDRRGADDEAEKLYLESLAMRRRFFGDTHLYVANSLSRLAALLVERGDFIAGEERAREALDILRPQLPPDDWRIGVVEGTLGRSLRGRGRYREAERLLRASYDKLLSQRGAEAPPTVQALDELCALHDAWAGGERPAECGVRE